MPIAVRLTVFLTPTAPRNVLVTAALNRCVSIIKRFNSTGGLILDEMSLGVVHGQRPAVVGHRQSPAIITARTSPQFNIHPISNRSQLNWKSSHALPWSVHLAQRRPGSRVCTFATSSVSPPPAEIEATCLRCVVSGVSGDLAEELGDVLLTLGAQSVVIQEHRPPGAPEQEIFDDGEARLWDSCDLVAHFPLEADVEGTLAVALDALDLSPESLPGGHRVEPVANESWVEQIKASYVPLQICEDLWIIPEWSDPHDPAATNIILQPGVAFGTGEHPTTRLCLRELRRMGAAGELRGASVCDYGTGSGVLALAALKYGAARAVGTDIDSLAVKAAQRNGALNGFEPPAFLALHCGGGIDEPEPLAQLADLSSPSSSSSSSSSPAHPAPQFDLVVANILRGPLVELQPRLSGYVRPGGRLMLSGILYEQAAEIREAYAAEFEDFSVETDQQWALLQARRRK